MRAPAAAGDPASAPQPPPQTAQRVQISPAIVAARQDTIAKTSDRHRETPAARERPAGRGVPLRCQTRRRAGWRAGPAAAPIELLEGLRTEDIDVNPAQLLSIASAIYPDKNPASGVFYFHPRSYHLEWTPETGHGMRILYGAAATAGSSGDVLMAAHLQSGLDSAEIQLATELLNAYRGRNNVPRFKALRPLPLEKDGLDVSLAAVLGQYSIPKEKIAITGLSDRPRRDRGVVDHRSGHERKPAARAHGGRWRERHGDLCRRRWRGHAAGPDCDPPRRSRFVRAHSLEPVRTATSIRRRIQSG